jgi:hypothetical protein
MPFLVTFYIFCYIFNSFKESISGLAISGPLKKLAMPISGIFLDFE